MNHSFCSVLVAFLLAFCSFPLAAQGYVDYTPFRTQKAIDDGIYESTVNYHSYTGYTATYILNVKVVDERVVVIYFGNGGSLHTGYNNEDYIYKGGYLTAHTSYGQVVAATTTVTVSFPYAEDPYIPGTYLYHTNQYAITIE
jgi:hypothetical protein